MTKLGLKCGFLDQTKIGRPQNHALYANSWLLAVQATTRVANDLVCIPSEKVFFARYLMFIIRVFTKEKTDMFRDNTQNA